MLTANFVHISSLDWSSKLGAFGEIVEAYEDIKQCISIILLTVKGSVPHRPEFGTEIFKYIDLPAQRAVPKIIYEATKALEKWEPRIVVNSVSVSALEYHHYQIKVSWSPVNEYDKTVITQEVRL